MRKRNSSYDFFLLFFFFFSSSIMKLKSWVHLYLSPRLHNWIQDHLFAKGFAAGSKDAGFFFGGGGNERIKACIRPGEEQRTDKASVMIIAVCQLPRRRKRRMRLLAPEKGHKGWALLVIFSLDSQVVTWRKTTQLPVIKKGLLYSTQITSPHFPF